jgi:hypothetical protein
LIKLPIGKAGRAGKGHEIGVGGFGGPIGFGFHEGLSPVFEVRVGFGGEPQVIELDVIFVGLVLEGRSNPWSWTLKRESRFASPKGRVEEYPEGGVGSSIGGFLPVTVPVASMSSRVKVVQR